MHWYTGPTLLAGVVEYADRTSTEKYDYPTLTSFLGAKLKL